MEQKTKTGKWKSLSTFAILFIIATAMVGLVAYAVSGKFNLGGSVNFSASGVEATVSAGKVSGGEIDDASSKLLEVIYSTDSSIDTSSDNEGSWDDVNLTITDTTGVATITFTITNNFSSDAIKVSIGSISGSNDEIEIQSNVTEEKIAAQDGLEVVITFTVKNTQFNASITKFSIPISITKVEGYEVEISGSIYAYATDGGSTYTLLSGSSNTITASEKVLFVLFYGGTSYSEDITDAPDWTITENTITERAEGTGEATSGTGEPIVRDVTVSLDGTDLDSSTIEYQRDKVGNSVYYFILINITGNCTITIS